MDADATIARLAARRRGLLVRKEAIAEGVTARQLQWRARRGVLVPIEPGIDRVAAAPATWEQRVLAACLADGGWASHRTAAALWALSGCRPGLVEVVTHRWRRRPNRSFRIHETRLLEPEDISEIDGIPVTSAERTVVDLGAVLPHERVVDAYHDALNRHLVTPESTWCCLERLDVPGRPWVARLRPVVGASLGRSAVAPNAFERRLVDVLRSAGLPEPSLQVEVRRPDGTLLARVDAAYLETKVVLECDSERWHGSWVRRKADLRRDRELTALGYRVLRFSWEDLVDRPTEVVRDVVGARRAASA